MSRSPLKTIFTLTAGRTGSAWLAEFLSRNLNCPAIHEPLEIDDFGTRMPDIKIMRSFNNFGNNATVQGFWKRKFSEIHGQTYIETNHTLGKCGLIENLSRSDLSSETQVIVLKRDIIRQCSSYLIRNDFINITIAWQWYLHPSYKKKLVNPKPFLKLDGLGFALWYCYEMSARQAYYKLYYGSKINMIEVELDEIVSPEGAQRFWWALGQHGACELPPRKNENELIAPPSLIEKLEKLTSVIQFDPYEIARNAFKHGFSFETSEMQ